MDMLNRKICLDICQSLFVRAEKECPPSDTLANLLKLTFLVTVYSDPSASLIHSKKSDGDGRLTSNRVHRYKLMCPINIPVQGVGIVTYFDYCISFKVYSGGQDNRGKLQ